MDIMIEKFANAKKYWLEKLSGEISEVKLLTDFPRTKHYQSTGYEFQFPEALTGSLVRFSKNSDISLYVILLTTLKILLFKVTGQDDIMIASPTLSSRKVEYNKFIVLRDRLNAGLMFKDLLMEIKQTVAEGYKNQYYPVRKIIESLNVENNFSFFRVLLVLENIHSNEFIGEITENFENDLILSVERDGERLQGQFTYNACCFTPAPVKSLVDCYLHILSQVLKDYRIRIFDIALLTGDRKQLILSGFNDTDAEYPGTGTLHQLFAEQVEKTPGNVAAVYERDHLTYSELNKKANQLAGRLRRKGVNRSSIVGIRMERSLEMLVGMLGILKAGGSYLPIDIESSANRAHLMLEDCRASFLLRTANTEIPYPGETVIVDELWDTLAGESGENMENINGTSDLAYIIYTSGSTGRPKGVTIQHRAIVNTLSWRKNYYRFNQDDRVLQIPSYTFDSSVEDIFTPLISGSQLVLIRQENRLNLDYLRELIEKNRPTHFLSVPGLYRAIMGEIGESLKGVRFVTVAGEHFTTELVQKHFELLSKVELYNEYGPTENSVCATVYRFQPGKSNVFIGKPISNVRCYILNRDGDLNPVGIPGELFIAGKGLASGYLNNPGLTNRRFVDNPFIPGEKMYMTGDMARWQQDGNIEFLGRMDFQVKISGYRIEPGEIEGQLLKHPGIKEAVVIAKESEEDKYLCAFFVLEAGSGEIEISTLIEYLGRELPDYMIPSYIEGLEKMPLTPNGKVDRKALESIVNLGSGSAGNYVAPRNKTEEKLAAIWAEVLGLEKDTISIDSNFFELGGQSLKATVMVSKIHKEFNAKIPLQEVFKSPLIKGLSEYIKSKSSTEVIYTSIEPAEEKECYALSPAQYGLYIIQQTTLESTAYNVPQILELYEKPDKERLEDTFRKLIKRHESLRTSFDIIDGKAVQRIHQRVEFEIEYYEEAVDGRWSMVVGEESFSHLPHSPHSPEDIIENFVRPFDLSQAPLLRVGLIKIEEEKYIFMVDIHHTISDGISNTIFIRDFTALYKGEELPKLRIRYRDYSQWQNNEKQEKTIKRQEEYWLKVFEGEIPVLNIPIDCPRAPLRSYRGNTRKFELGKEKSKALNKLALEGGTTLYMVLLSIYNVMLSKLSGQQEIIVGTVTAGRRHADLDQIMGMFINPLALKNYSNRGKTFLEFLGDVNRRTLEAFENQEYPFEYLADKLIDRRQPGRNPLFDTVFALENMEDTAPKEGIDQDESSSAILKLKNYDYTPTTSKFDLSLDARESRDNLVFSFEYSTKLFKQETIERFFGFFKEIVSAVIDDPGKKISQIEILSTKEKHKLQYDFNNTRVEYPGNRTIHELIEEQVEKTPGKIAVVSKEENRSASFYITYKELNEKSNQLARLLREKGVKSNTVVGIMVDNSQEMMVGILGILKAGAAFLPIDTKLPENRVLYMLKDCSVSLLLTKTNILEKHSFTALQNLHLPKPTLTVTGVRPQVTRLDDLPLPDRSLVDYETYSRYIGLTMFTHTFALQGTRGCPYNCAYCHKIWPRNHVVRSAEHIFSEVLFYYRMGVQRFAFIDDVFNLDRKNSRRFFELIIENQLDVQLFFPNGFRGDILTEEYIDLAVKAGTVNIALSLETASPRLQKLIGKNIDIEKLRENIQYICEKYPQVILALQTMHGFPTETEEEALMTLNFMKGIKGIHFPYLHILKIYPNTDMANLALRHGVSSKAIEQSAHLAYHDLPETLPFEKEFTLRFQAEFLNDYVLSKERLLHVLPHQLNILTKDELVQKYDSYLPTRIDSLEDLYEFAGITGEELGIEGMGANSHLQENHMYEPGLNERMNAHYPPREMPGEGALRVLLLDLSQYFSSAKDMLYDVVEPPLGLMYLLSYLNREFPGKINGKIAKSRIDFDNYDELKTLLEEFKPDIIGVRALTFHKDFFHQTISIIRQWGIEAPVIAGGPYATSDYKTILNDRNIDLVVKGEGEITFAEIIGKIMENEGKLPPEEDLKTIKGIVYVPGKTGLKTRDTCEMIMMDEIPGWNIEKYRQNLDNVNAAHDLAYVIYTSGSTGKPNGVMVRHRSLINLCHWHKNCYSVSSSDRATKYAGFGFDASVWEIFPYLISGASILVPDDEIKLDMHELSRYFEKNQVTISFLPTQVGEQFMKRDTHSLGKLLVGGDKLRVFYNSQYDVYNNYGPTENTVVATFYRVGRNLKEIPIGKPIDNTRIYILNREGKQLQPVGIPGELYIAGDSLARGYCNNPEKTNDKFAVALFQDGESEKLFRTGDLARWLPDGNIEFLGRIDNQVKIRGNRIELGEIEDRLLKHKDIKEAIVLAKKVEKEIEETGESGESYLCAYLVSSKNLAASQLIEYLSGDLPDYMVPAYFVTLKKFPLTVNDKIDVNALPEPVKGHLSGEPGSEYIAPRNEVEETLAGIWEEILGKHPIGINENFFLVGGDSIKSIQIASSMNECGYKVEMNDIFRYPTISQLVPQIKRITRVRDQSIVIGILPLTPIQKRFFKTVDIDAHHYNQAVMFYSKERLDKEALKRVFSKIQEHHDALRIAYKEVNGEIIQENHGRDYPLSLEDYEFQDQGNDEKKKALEIKINEIQASIDLANGPLMKLGLFHLDDGDRLLIAIHHLVIDGISWRILFKDIEALYQQYKRGEPLKLPAKTDSFKFWAEQLTEYANSESFLEEKNYWGKLESQSINIPLIKGDYDNEEDNYVKDSVTRTFNLDEDATDMLLSKVNEAFGTEINDILLTALGLAFRETFGHDRVLIAMEGHGRENILKDIDIGRTVGWFTAVYPVLLEISYPDDISRQVKEIKETLRRLPNKGTGYGLLKYLTSEEHRKEIAFELEPQVSFNYLGQFGSDIGRMSFGIARESVGNIQPAKTKRQYLLEVSGIMTDRRLVMSIVYNKKQFKTGTVERLMNHFETTLRDIIIYCSEKEERELTPSDLTYNKLSVEDIEALEAVFDN